ncbi:hypothetical protein HYH03_005472 [Edaphochlamys debaryana]|uniref:Uncharacterized protein n=1 Tax=Edaphochlamys debaryana TaxID=47281 RepID=A0A835Y5B6_9CHLO|nr:hypothetical protein HYH03_005472 [Edaphochlamys debaryana]|eukprot:KAG2496652.1 hypothetical protein HYH03_005472 [Edaphochlamys debaryana]
MGATRFDVAVRALRGELDPPAWVENTERSSGVLLAALYQFPRSYCFQVVGRPEPGPSGGDGSPDAFAADVAATVAAVAQAEVPEGGVVIKPRMGGRYVSVSVDVVVRAPEIVEMVYQKLGEDSRVIMRF